jgi:hypothetical protein
MSRLSLYLSCLLFATPGLLIAQAPPKDSPFRKAQGPVAARPVADQPTELTLSGTMSLGGTIMVCITVVAEKRSHWIKVGESASRIEVLSHNQENGQVSIRYNGKPLTLELSKPAFNTSALSQYSPVPSGPLPVATVALDVPMTNAQKESEARYLVSDLLEIGIIQREAYKKAQGGTPPVEAPGPRPANP